MDFNSLSIELRSFVITVNVKRAKSKETAQTDNARSLSLFEIGYQSSLERLLDYISIKFNTLQFRS